MGTSPKSWRIGSLFSGIGGLDLGLERAGCGRTIWQVEIDPWRRRVLALHWPDAERFEDVRSVGKATLAPVDIICGGFPCKNVSSAGDRTGLDGPHSGLWREYARIVAELRPAFVVVENVTSGAALWVDAVRSDLERTGYASLPITIAASDLGAPHRRSRIFVVAHLDGERAIESRRREAGPGASVAARDGAQRDPCPGCDNCEDSVYRQDEEEDLAMAEWDEA